MDIDDDPSPRRRAEYKAKLIEEILREDDLYKVLGSPRDATPTELRRHYLDRSKICHPDRLPHHDLSTQAFQRLGFAFEILKSPSSRRTYDRASRYGGSGFPRRPSTPGGSLNGDTTFRTAVETLLSDFLHGDFSLVQHLLTALHKQYPNVISTDVIASIERSWTTVRELLLTTRAYALLVSIELGRIHRVTKKLRSLGYLDIFGRMRVTAQLVKVTLALPMRVDRALRVREARRRRAKEAGWSAAGVGMEELFGMEKETVGAGAAGAGTRGRGGILNERVLRVLEYIVGESAVDPEADAAWLRVTASARG